jgi:hypothetical protein
MTRRKNKSKRNAQQANEPNIHTAPTMAGLGSPPAGRELVVEIEAQPDKWLRVAGVSYKALAEALLKKLENEGHRVRVREAPAEEYDSGAKE